MLKYRKFGLDHRAGHLAYISVPENECLNFIDLERGVRRNGQLIATDIQDQIDTVRSVAQHEGLSQKGLERINKAERVVPKMQATIAFVSGYVRQQDRSS